MICPDYSLGRYQFCIWSSPSRRGKRNWEGLFEISLSSEKSRMISFLRHDYNTPAQVKPWLKFQQQNYYWKYKYVTRFPTTQDNINSHQFRDLCRHLFQWVGRIPGLSHVNGSIYTELNSMNFSINLLGNRMYLVLENSGILPGLLWASNWGLMTLSPGMIYS